MTTITGGPDYPIYYDPMTGAPRDFVAKLNMHCFAIISYVFATANNMALVA